MRPEILRDHVIAPVLKYMDMHSVEAENLLLGTAAQESQMGRYIHQLGAGPAKGVWQMEPTTESDIWENFITYRDDLDAKMRMMLPPQPVPGTSPLLHNLAYSCAMARLQYRRAPEPLPDTVEGMASLWKLRYNTPQGKGTEEEFIENYHRYVLGDDYETQV